MSNPANVRYMPWLAVISLALGFLLPFAVSAESATLQIAPAVPPAPPAHMVRELLEADAQRALVNERLSHASSANAASGITTVSPTSVASASSFETGNVPAVQVKPAPPVRLKGIVGVGMQLSAIVNIDGQDVIYRAGQALPALGPDKGLRLVKIATPCAKFTDTRHDTETHISACLNEVHP